MKKQSGMYTLLVWKRKHENVSEKHKNLQYVEATNKQLDAHEAGAEATMIERQ